MKYLLILTLSVAAIGCSSTESHRQNHEASVIENEYILQMAYEAREAGDGTIDAEETIPHLEQQRKHLQATREWLGAPESPVVHNHESQNQIIQAARRDTEARGILTSLWKGAVENWPWLGLLGGVGGLALRWLGHARTFKRVTKQIVVGVQDAKESADENGLLSRETINDAVTTATTLLHDPKLRDQAERIIEDAKRDREVIKKKIKRATSSS